MAVFLPAYRTARASETAAAAVGWAGHVRRKTTMSAADRSRTLMFYGFLLFLLALATGLFINQLPNPRLGQGAHITGLMNGMFLVLLALAWDRLRLGARTASWVAGLVLFGAYANWGFSLLAALLGTGKLTPLASGGHVAEPWKRPWWGPVWFPWRSACWPGAA